jgi:hypothetical protein
MTRWGEKCLVLRSRNLHLLRDYFEFFNNREILISRHGVQVLLVNTCWTCVFYTKTRGPSSSVGIAIGYRLDGPGIESRWGRDFPHLPRPTLGSTQLPVQWVPDLFREWQAAIPLLSLRAFVACKCVKPTYIKIPSLKYFLLPLLSIAKPTWCTFYSFLLRIKGLYMFQTLLAHLQKALQKRHLVYCVRVMSVDCARMGMDLDYVALSTRH